VKESRDAEEKSVVDLNVLADLGLQVPFNSILAGSLIVLVAGLALHAILAVSSSKKLLTSHRRGWFAKLVYLAFALLVAGLSLTSFGSLLTQGVLEHWALLAHVGLAGAFVFVMVLFALVWNPVVLSVNRSPIVTANPESPPAPTASIWWLAKLSLWGVLICSIVTAASMLIAMLPILDTDGMHASTSLHRLSGLALLICLVVHLYSLALRKLGWR
jgi:hypothetical protein